MPIAGCTPLLLKRHSNDKIDVMAVEDLVSSMGLTFQSTPELDFISSVSGLQVWSGSDFTNIKSIRMINNDYNPTIRASSSLGCIDVSSGTILMGTNNLPFTVRHNDSFSTPVHGGPLQYSLPSRNLLNKLCHAPIMQSRAQVLGAWFRMCLKVPQMYYDSHRYVSSMYTGEGKKMCFTGRNQLKLPNDILNSSAETRSIFLKEFFKSPEEATNGPVAAQSVVLVAKSLGMDTNVKNKITNSRKTLYEKDKYVLQRIPKRTVRSNGYVSYTSIPKSRMPVHNVYTLETDAGNFAAGVGGMVVKY